MSFEEVMATVQPMLVTLDTLAAIGADLSVKTSGPDADPGIVSTLAAVSAAAGVPDLDTLRRSNRRWC